MGQKLKTLSFQRAELVFQLPHADSHSSVVNPVSGVLMPFSNLNELYKYKHICYTCKYIWYTCKYMLYNYKHSGKALTQNK